MQVLYSLDAILGLLFNKTSYEPLQANHFYREQSSEISQKKICVKLVIFMQ